MVERNFSPEKDASGFHPRTFHCDDVACEQASGWRLVLASRVWSWMSGAKPSRVPS